MRLGAPCAQVASCQTGGDLAWHRWVQVQGWSGECRQQWVPSHAGAFSRGMEWNSAVAQGSCVVSGGTSRA
jgi:hypothetical protein